MRRIEKQLVNLAREIILECLQFGSAEASENFRLHEECVVHEIELLQKDSISVEMLELLVVSGLFVCFLLYFK